MLYAKVECFMIHIKYSKYFFKGSTASLACLRKPLSHPLLLRLPFQLLHHSIALLGGLHDYRLSVKLTLSKLPFLAIFATKLYNRQRLGQADLTTEAFSLDLLLLLLSPLVSGRENCTEKSAHTFGNHLENSRSMAGAHRWQKVR